MSVFNQPHFTDPDKAREYLEAQVWPDGPVCPHCGSIGDHYQLKGKTTRPGLYKCKDCREPFTVTVGTLFERSKVPLNKWLLAVYLLCSSKKGMSSHQLHRTLGVTYKTAWFMAHRIREAMREPTTKGDLGGGGSTVEADETFWGGLNTKRRAQGKKGRGYEHKEKILTLVERNGRARSFHVPRVNAATLKPIMQEQIKADSKLMTDEGMQYHPIGKEFASHGVTRHGIGEYVRGDIHSNTVEGYFSILKRGLKGTYQHVSAKHLKRYLGEFDFRYNHRVKLGYSDSERADMALKGIQGKRMTYRRIDSGQESAIQ